jgi:D-3-phosphoglycerate dehydrogenase / 2-oxoglutarate reductase
MGRFTVLVTDFAWPSLEIEREILARVDADLLVAETGDAEELTALAPQADAILTNWSRIPTEALDTAPRCVVVSRFGIGVDNIPVERATELGILVTNVPAFCIDEVSDHTMALLLACSRHVVPLANAVRRGAWSLDPARGQHRLRGQTLGIVGFGAIARSLVPKAAGFGLKLLAYTPRLDSTSLPAGVERAATLDELLLTSDFVTLHAPATTATRGLIGERELRLMKPSAYLINTSRGALVDEAALNRAIAEGWVAGAALDVLAAEPPTPGNPLLAVDGVLVTPHTAFYSEEAVVDLETRAAANVAAVLSGRLPEAIVNAAVLDRPDLRFRAA